MTQKETDAADVTLDLLAIQSSALEAIRPRSRPTPGPQRPSCSDATMRWLTRRGPYFDQHLAGQAWAVVAVDRPRKGEEQSWRIPTKTWRTLVLSSSIQPPAAPAIPRSGWMISCSATLSCARPPGG